MAKGRFRLSKRGKITLIVAAVLVVLTVVLILTFTGVFKRLFDRITGNDSRPVEPATSFFEFYPKGESDVAVLKDMVLVADEAGVTCFSKKGEWMWSRDLTLSAPVFTVGDGIAVLGDIGGSGIYGFNDKGMTWTYAFPSDIIAVSNRIAGNRIIVIHKDENYISAASLVDFSSDVKVMASRKFGEYYMMSASISNDGRQAAVCGIAQDTGRVKTVISYARMSDYEFFKTVEMAGEFLPLVNYVSSSTAFASGGDGVYRVVVQADSSSSGDSKKAIWTRNGGGDNIVAVCAASGSYATVTTPAGSDPGLEGQSQVKIYDASGNEKFAFRAEGGINGIRLKGDYVALFADNYLYLYRTDGTRIGECSTISQIFDVEFITERELAVSGVSKMGKVDFTK